MRPVIQALLSAVLFLTAFVIAPYAGAGAPSLPLEITAARP